MCPCQNHAKVYTTLFWMRNFLEFWEEGSGLSKLGTWLVVVFLVLHAFPYIQILDVLLQVILMLDQDAAINSAPIPFSIVEPCSFLGWSNFFMGWTVRVYTIYMWSISWGCDCKGCSMIRFVTWTVPWLAPMYFLLLVRRVRLLCVWDHSPLKSMTDNLNIESLTETMPVQSLPNIPTISMQTKNLSDKIIKGDHGHLKWQRPLGGQEYAVGLKGLQKALYSHFKPLK